VSARQRRAKAQHRKQHAVATRGVAAARPLASATLGGVLATSFALGVAATAKAATTPLHAATAKHGTSQPAPTFSVSELRNIDQVPAGGRPSDITAAGGTVFFTAYDPAHGRELWKSDGTPGGTALVKDIDSGSAGSYPADLTNVNGTLYFVANDGSSGYELWKSDGTAAGTVLVKDINPGAYSSYPSGLANMNGTLYFAADDGTHGNELWTSNGTADGTSLVDDINPGAQGSRPSNLTPVGSTLFFSANDGTDGTELWKSNSTDGTVLVKDIDPGGYSYGGYNYAFGSNPTDLTDVGGTLFFVANDGTNGYELWKSDGSADGTVLVKDIRPGGFGAFAYYGEGQLTNMDGTLFFVANDGTYGNELWKSDGTTGGTVLVDDINPGSTGSSPSDLTVVGHTLYFAAIGDTYGRELWKSDGTSSGTVLVKDVNPHTYSYEGYTYDLGSYPADLTDVGGTLFFAATDGTAGAELWKSDGTTDGTVQVKDINPGGGGSMYYRGYFTDAGGTLYFAANDGSSGGQLWKSDGSGAGTVAVSAIDGGDLGSYPGSTADVDGTLFFAASDPTNGRELWKSDGTPAGTVLVEDIVPGSYGSYPTDLTDVNGELFFDAGGELWKSDGTAAGTMLVKSIAARHLTNVNGTLFFSAGDSTNGNELWKSDGTADGTVLVKDIDPGASGSNPGELTKAMGMLFFSADDGTHGRELWKSNGTPAGTVLVKNINHGTISYGGNTYPASGDPIDLTKVNGTLFFSANDGTYGRELWKSDGTPAGTVLVKDINPGTISYYGNTYPAGSNPFYLTNVNGTLFFTANDGTNGTELWQSNGTADGTALVKDIRPGAPGSYPTDLTEANGTLFFAADDATNGNELWRSDGTADGTALVKDIRPGGGSAFGYYGGGDLTNVNGTLFFVADDGTNGYELWQSDGTADGTVLVKDIRPGRGGSFYNGYSYLTNVNGTLFFSANDGTTGYELWHDVDATSTDVSCAPSSVTTGDASTCTVTVTDNASTGATTPTGAVDLAPSPTTGSLGSTSCTLAALNGTSSTCTVTFTPSAAGGYTITGTYTPADFRHDTSTGFGTVTAAAPPPDPTSTGVSCAPSSVTTGDASTCTITVTDTASSGATTPTGAVDLAPSPTTGSLGSTSCTLATKDATSATCDVTFTPSAAGAYTITGAYAGDSGHASSTGSGTVTATVLAPPVASVKKVTVSGTKAKVEISCKGQAGQKCTTTLKLSATETVGTGKHKRKKRIVVGRATKTVAAGDTVAIDISLNSAGKKLLEKRDKLHVTLKVTEHGTTVATKKLTFTTKQH
jgi:ELWxxDGT repeat protein